MMTLLWRHFSAVALLLNRVLFMQLHNTVKKVRLQKLAKLWHHISLADYLATFIDVEDFYVYFFYINMFCMSKIYHNKYFVHVSPVILQYISFWQQIAFLWIIYLFTIMLMYFLYLLFVYTIQLAVRSKIFLKINQIYLLRLQKE